MKRSDATQAAHQPSWWRTSKIWWLLAIFAVLTLLIVVVIEKAGNPALMPYSTFLDQLEAGNVASVTFQGTEINGRFKRPLDSTLPDTFRSRVPDFGDPTLIQELRKQHVVIDVSSPPQWTSLLARLPWPMLLFLGAVMAAGLVTLLRGRMVQLGSTVSMHPMHGMMGLVTGLFAKPQPGASPLKHDSDELKIAFPTDDGVTISAYLGRAKYYMVATLEGSNTPKFEKRDKACHGNDRQEHHEAWHDHNAMFAPLADCQVLIAGGMGQPAFDHAQGMGLKVLLTGDKMISAALEAYRSNTLVSDMRRVHARR